MQFRKAPVPLSIPMHHERLEWCLEVIGWSKQELSRRLGVSEGAASQMCRGKRNIPHRVAAWVETYVAFVQALPTPFLWGRTVGSGPEPVLGGDVPGAEDLEKAWNPSVNRHKPPELGDRRAVRELLGEEDQ